jgi:hypothetical protein
MSNLFTAVSVEQQEIVTGGVITLGLVAAQDSLYSALQQAFTNNTRVGPGGVERETSIGSVSITSRAIENAIVTPFSFPL